MSKVYKFIYKYNILSVVLALAIYIVFNNSIEDFLETVFVNSILAKVDSTWYNDLVFSITVVILVLIFNKKQSISPNFKYTILFVFFVYVFYRFFIDRWTFTSFKIYSDIKYSDIGFIVVLGTFWLSFKKDKKLPENTKDSFFDDEPLSGDKKDELGFSRYINTIADKVRSSHFEKAFAIGINGKWGSGKTSFINLLKKELDKNEFISIDFNPWNSYNPKAIIQDFFETMQEAVKPHEASLAKLLIAYSNKLISLNDNTVTQSIKTFITPAVYDNSLNGLFSEINKDLRIINKKVVIYIDDLDRLDKSEIIEVIRLIRNTANFYNTFFIVAYDRNYISYALKEYNAFNHEQFLEKIFQIEISLPYYNKTILREQLEKKLSSVFPSQKVAFGNDIIGSYLGNPYYLDIWIENIRDVTRLTNSLSINFKKLEGEVIFHEFIRLEILRLKHPSVYELLYKQPQEFLETPTMTQLPKLYSLKKESFKKYLISQSTISENNTDEILDLVAGIFDDGISVPEVNKHLSVRYPSKFYRYFAYGLLEGNLSEVEFSNARSSSTENFKLKIKEWVGNNLSLELRFRFKEISVFDDVVDFENIISGIFYFANLKSPSNQFYFYEKNGYDNDDLISKLNDYDRTLSKKYYSNPAELYNFIKNLLIKVERPYIFEATLIHSILSKGSFISFPIKSDELEEIIISYLEKYCQGSAKFDKLIWKLYWCCEVTDWILAGNSSYIPQKRMPEKAKEVLRSFVLEKDFDGFLFEIIEATFDVNMFRVHSITCELFENWTEFKKILIAQDDEKWSYLSEFKEFFALFEATGFKKYVNFEFKDIDLSSKYL